MNKKQIHRLCRQEGLKVFKRQKKRNISHSTAILAPSRRNQVWSCDFIFDQTTNGRALKMLTVIDVYTRECHRIEVNRRLTSTMVVGILKKLFSKHGSPEYLRCDNGSEFVAKAIRKWLKTVGVDTQYIEPGAPWQNGYIEIFHDKLRDECLNANLFYSVPEASSVVEEWRMEYNTIRPHSSLGRVAPAVFAVRILAQSNSDGATGLPTARRCAVAA